jgi:hypothetical protein
MSVLISNALFSAAHVTFLPICRLGLFPGLLWDTSITATKPSSGEHLPHPTGTIRCLHSPLRDDGQYLRSFGKLRNHQGTKKELLTVSDPAEPPRGPSAGSGT